MYFNGDRALYLRRKFFDFRTGLSDIRKKSDTLELFEYGDSDDYILLFTTGIE